MKTCICGRTEMMWNTHKVGVTADNIVNIYSFLSYSTTHSLLLSTTLTPTHFSFIEKYLWETQAIPLIFN